MKSTKEGDDVLKILVSGSYPLSEYIKEDINKMRHSIQDLNIQEVDSKHLLKNPYYINNDDILICGVVLAERLKKLNVRGHIVPLRVQTRDFIHALAKASMYSGKICVVNYYKEFIDNSLVSEEQLKNMFGLQVEQYTYTSTEHAEEVVKKLGQDSTNIIIGSGLVVNFAKKYGMIGVLWYGKDTIRLCVNIAFDILRAKVLERSNHQRQSIVMENFQEGVISLNQVNRVIHMNQAAKDILNLDASKNYSSDMISLVLDKGELLNVIESAPEQTENIIKHHNKTLIVTKHNVSVNQQNEGQIIFIADVERLQQKENRVRRKLNKKNEGAHYTFENIIGQSPQMMKAKQKAQKFSRSDANVLILGESGTGKELFAQSIHNASKRKNEPFVAVNCAALPENLVESEFFGYSEGAFTGAVKGGKAGLFEVAHNGTIFLDEIGELPLSMQAKLLRVLQEKTVRRVGSTTSIPINVRVISATNVNLMESIKKNEFRMDLYYRIAVLNLFLPNFNQRREDVGLLLKHFAIKSYPEMYKVIEPYFDDLLPLLQAHDWQGNVREFENTIERFFAYISGEDALTKDWIVSSMEESLKENEYLVHQVQSVNETFQQTMKNLEYVRIQEVLEQTNGNKQEAAKILGISRSTLWRKMNEAQEEAGQY